ncbi:potassium transporter Kup [Maridesulfovibrio hydrothermalis]|uniref:Probable potassium transport system protein Kup n=1 Tax=Maridesulfovibrio hydrothermalis AM13 = DSM 14728 TaxID=1121451 RepID=L0RGB2_9BACT|nr:KUP/HAK/KT family potassium transporter [Maridesulfovibrio hydrothermalis]CCO24606.1 putative potassium transport system protein kup 1 [Maridesulfovibrio hydrothermalis AM13 = DSM 14728]
MQKNNENKRQAALALGALGVVFGDIGTSPLYAIKACFSGHHAVALNTGNVLGVLSLIIWSLFIVICLKYVTFVMAADNDGEGGIFALYELVCPKGTHKSFSFMLIATLLGGALLYGDGVITPAISVLSAIEGLDIATTAAHQYTTHIACTILLVLFAFQSSGTDKIGRLFGPVMLTWFGVIGVSGFCAAVQNLEVLEAFSPFHAIRFFAENGIAGCMVLGAVVLCVTGGEALFADMGHFGRKPITQAWYFIALPSLLLNYLGQGAMLINTPEAIINPFFSLFPKFLLLPMVGLATFAAIIASQAIISGAFSLTAQAVHLGFIPRIRINQTSEDNPGQVYVRSVNWIMAVLCILLVVFFKESENLAGAYGIAITGTMVVTTYLFWFYLRKIRGWTLVPAALLVTFFACFDLGFFIVNFTKIMGGGWFPILLAGLIAYVMFVWIWGRAKMHRQLRERGLEVAELEPEIEKYMLAKVPGEAVFLSASNFVPHAFIRHLRNNRVVHEKLVFLRVQTANEPFVDSRKRISVKKLEHNISWLTVTYGFMEKPNLSLVLVQAWNQLGISSMESSFYLGRTLMQFNEENSRQKLKRKLFIILSSMAEEPLDYLKIPAEKVVTIGTAVKI